MLRRHWWIVVALVVALLVPLPLQTLDLTSNQAVAQDDDPFGPATGNQADPFGGGSDNGEDPFGAGPDTSDDPFGPSENDRDPFGGDSGGSSDGNQDAVIDDDPFGERALKEKRAAVEKDDPFRAQPPKTSVDPHVKPATTTRPVPMGGSYGTPHLATSVVSSAAAKQAEAAIELALNRPTEFDFIEAPLEEVVDFLRESHDIAIYVDVRALDDIGIGTDTPITMRVKGITLRSALAVMLRELDLTWTIHAERLFITTAEEEDTMLRVCVYPVADLVACQDDEGEPWDDYQSLSALIQTSVVPTSWTAVGGPGSIAAGSFSSAKVLVIRQTYQVQREIAALLAELRATAKRAGYQESTPRRNSPYEMPVPSDPFGDNQPGGMF